MTDLLRHGELLNRLILNRTTAEELGRVDDLWVNSQDHRVLGFVYKIGFLPNQKKTLALGQLETIGPDAIMVSGQTGEELAPEEQKAGETVIGSEVWTEKGSRIGRITDYLFDPATGLVQHYLFVPAGFGGLTEGTYELVPDAVTAVGKKRMIVSEAATEQLKQHSEGLRQRLTSAVGQARGLFEQAREKVSERAKELSEQARERAQELSEQARERAEQARDYIDQVRDRGSQPPTLDVPPTALEPPTQSDAPEEPRTADWEAPPNLQSPTDGVSDPNPEEPRS